MNLLFNDTSKPLCLAVATKPGDLWQRNVWLQERFLSEKPQLPFLFVYGEKKSEGFRFPLAEREEHILC